MNFGNNNISGVLKIIMYALIAIAVGYIFMWLIPIIIAGVAIIAVWLYIKTKYKGWKEQKTSNIKTSKLNENMTEREVNQFSDDDGEVIDVDYEDIK